MSSQKGSDAGYRWLVRFALGLGVMVLVISIYDCNIRARSPGDLAHLEADNLFEDGNFKGALEKYNRALLENPQHIHALRGKARTLLKLGRHDEAMIHFNEAIVREPDFGASYANRGILNDTMGRPEAAVEDYEMALRLDPELGKGPHWLTRFLRLQPDKPAGIAERAAYLRAELAKPVVQRRLREPEQDAMQRSYKQ